MILKECVKIMLNIKCMMCGSLLPFSIRINDFAGNKYSNANTICTNCGHLLITRKKNNNHYANH